MKKFMAFIRAACTRFTLLLFLLYVLFLLLLDPETSSRVIDFARLIELFVLACALEGIHALLELNSLPKFTRILLHLCLTFLAFFIVFFLAKGVFTNLPIAVLLVFIFSLLYCAVDSALYFLNVKRKKKTEKTDYTSMF
ncbi:MAG: hypothetical protein IJU41_07775 [Clostridia bacterium]|nr:hypothetical protein [Clostridia bacterium]